MNGLVRRVAVLSVLWGMCEMLLPGDKYQPIIRATAGLLVVAALLSSAAEWLGMPVYAQQTATQMLQQNTQAAYLRTALEAAAGQLENYCERIAQRAGYRAQATAYLTMKGETEKIELKVGTGESVLTDEHQLREALSQALGIAQERIVILVEEP